MLLWRQVLKKSQTQFNTFCFFLDFALMHLEHLIVVNSNPPAKVKKLNEKLFCNNASNNYDQESDKKFIQWER